MKTIIVYYSLEGNTEQAATKISELLSCEVLSIKPKKPLDGDKSSKFAIGGMQATFGMKPAIEDCIVDFDQYDIVILGFPIWAGKLPPYMNTFLKKNKVHQKVSAVFTLSGSGDNTGCIRRIKKKLPNLNIETSLLDKANKDSVQNDEKIKQFIADFTDYNN